MCKWRTLKAELSVGALLSLCPKYARHLADATGLDSGESAAEQLFAAFAARSAVIEYDYFDLDYRSEFSLLHEMSFTSNFPAVIRIHFFSEGIAPGRHNLDAFVRRHAGDYLGYSIIRLQKPASVGRSLVPPVAECRELAAQDELSVHVRTAVAEKVQLFGEPLTAVGIPFMEQDGQLLRCAHVVGWMAHYSMVLRGIVPRRASADFHLAEDPSRSYGRNYPSRGLSVLAQGRVLSQLDLPPDVIDGAQLMDNRILRWYDRPALFEAIQTLNGGELLRVWFAENLTSTVCRYLNSGFPVILSSGEHSQLICGYLRDEDMAPKLTTAKLSVQTDVSAFVVHDDQRGPYQVQMVEDILDGLMDEPSATFSLLVPLPRGLWLSGKAAETAGAALFESAVQERFAAMGRRRRSARRFRHSRDRLAELDKITTSLESGVYAIRSYALMGTDFKADFVKRVNDPEAARVVGYAQLPKYVWLVEVIDRDLRAKRAPAVVGTVVIDGSAVSEEGVTRPPNPIIIHIPGQISQVGSIDDDPFADENWHITHVRPYFTGRWNHRHSTYMSEERLAARLKGAF